MQRKTFIRYLGAALGMAAFTPALTGCGGGTDTADLVDTTISPAPVSTTDPVLAQALSPDEIAGLLYMREEEKLAHDVYLALFNKWGTQVFASIADSETEHTEAIRQLILSHGLEDPAATTLPGVFVNADLQALYDKLVAMGQPSLSDALAVGCLVEETDIRDIQKKLALVFDEPDIVQVYERLLCGSGNHLRAFNDKLRQEGVTYVPQVLSQAEWDTIANTGKETCGG